jgi:hypothetical protein
MPTSGMKKFDLNIEKVLEDWGVHHALREVIANALDEQALTNTKDVEIYGRPTVPPTSTHFAALTRLGDWRSIGPLTYPSFGAAT